MQILLFVVLFHLSKVQEEKHKSNQWITEIVISKSLLWHIKNSFANQSTQIKAWNEAQRDFVIRQLLWYGGSDYSSQWLVTILEFP